MIANVLNRDFVLAHLDAAERQLGQGARGHGLHGRLEAEEAELALRALHLTKQLHEVAAPPSASRADQLAFISRSPVVSLVQSVLEEMIEERLGDKVADLDPGETPHPAAGRVLAPDGSNPDQERMGEAFTLDDPRWEVDIAEALAERLVRRGRHPFNPEPAPGVELASDARLVVLGDWGSGLPRARQVAVHARKWLLDARSAGRDTHAVHLGDVYYAGEKREYDRRMLDPGMWPVEPGEAEAIPSWNLNGNHDMYSGGFGYFDHLLADERFRRQRTPDGQGTSWFELAAPEWRVVGLDTAWHDHLLMHTQWGDLEGPQGKRVAAWAHEDDGRKLLLLSHHQLCSAYDPKGVGPTIERELRGALDTGRVRGWIWGHEHRCMGYEPHEGVEFGRCVGHAGVPVEAHAESEPVPAPGTWEYRGQFESHGAAWARFGFVVLDFDGPSIGLSYVDEEGNVTRKETIA